jgi:hypothetical protein
MTEAEVLQLLGPPHDIFEGDYGDKWTYREGFLGLPLYSVRFKQDGLVEGWHVH